MNARLRLEVLCCECHRREVSTSLDVWMSMAPIRLRPGQDGSRCMLDILHLSAGDRLGQILLRPPQVANQNHLILEVY